MEGSEVDTKKRKQPEGPSPKEDNKAYYDIYGPSAKPEIELKLGFKNCMKIRDLQDLILWIIGDGIAPKWVFVKNKPLIKKIVFVLLQGVDDEIYKQNQTLFPFLTSMTSCETQAPGSKNRVYPPMGAFLNCAVPKKENKEKLNKKKKKKLKELESQRPGPLHYILTEDELLDNNFPIASQLDKSIDSNWISLPLPSSPSNTTSQLIAIDCEMCSTSNGLELTRISIVDEKHTVLYDTFVVPSSPILDYHTKYSGITPQLLENCKVTLKEVQAKLIEILHSEVILVGHSLENDLLALKLVHNKVIDTSVLYPNQRGSNFKNALKFLSQKYLNTTIQAESHDSIVDATTAMKLALLKIEKGPKFGGLEEDTESIFKVLESSNNKCAMIDTPNLLKQYCSPSTNAIPVVSDKDAVDKLIPVAANPNFNFVWSQFHELDDLYANNNSNKEDISPKRITDIIKTYDSYLNNIYESLPKNALLLTITGCGNLHSIRELIQKKQKNSSEWTPEDEILLEKKVFLIRKAQTFFKLK